MKTPIEVLIENTGEGYVKKLPKATLNNITNAMIDFANQNNFEPEEYKIDPIELPRIGIVVDGSTTGGNPGNTEYQGIDISTGKRMFGLKIGVTTNNVGEFVAIVHAIKYTRDNKINVPIYSDSVTAISWVKKRKCNSNNFGEAKKLVDNCLTYLKTIEEYDIKKWDTRNWGENPADFNRKK